MVSTCFRSEHAARLGRRLLARNFAVAYISPPWKNIRMGQVVSWMRNGGGGERRTTI